MHATTPNHEQLAKDFLKMTSEELKAKYPDDTEVQGALAQLSVAYQMCETETEMLKLEKEVMRRIALNLAQGLPVQLPDLDRIYRQITAPE